MANTPPDREPLTVRLPTERGRDIEALHELAWRDLLDLLPGAVQALLDQAASQNGVTAEALGEGATVGFDGGCGSDLFVVCNECQGDRAVIEVKGPTAKVNWRKKHYAWQTVLGCWDYPAGIERQASRRRSDGDGVVWLR